MYRSRNHCIIRYNVEKELFEIMALEVMQLNDREINQSNGFQTVIQTDKLYFYCSKCYIPHLYYFILPIRDYKLAGCGGSGGATGAQAKDTAGG